MAADVTATCRIALQVRPHSPPYEGGVAVPRRKRIRSEMARPGWSLTSYVAECDLKHGARATTPSAPSKVASQHLLDGAATPPLRGGEHPFLQFIHTFLRPGLNYAAAPRL